MNIIIDGYNLLKYIAKSSHVNEKQLRNFISMLGQYAVKKQHKILVVFDGEPYSIISSRYINIKYTGTYESADEYIINYVQRNKLKDTLVVSSDNGLINSVDHEGLYTIRSDAFYNLIKDQDNDSLSQEPEITNIIKLKKDRSEQENSDLDKLMISGSQDIVYKDKIVEKPDNDKLYPKKLSKKEKKILNIIKKI